MMTTVTPYFTAEADYRREQLARAWGRRTRTRAHWRHRDAGTRGGRGSIVTGAHDRAAVAAR